MIRIKIDGKSVKASEADGLYVQDYIRLSSDGVMLVLETGANYKTMCLSTDDARKLAANPTEIADQHDALMAEREGAAT